VDKLHPDYMQLQSTLVDSQRAMISFIETELDLAMTFCRTATTSNEEARIRRNIELADRAVSSAKHFITYLEAESVDPPVIGRIQKGLAQLERAIGEIRAKTDGDGSSGAGV
jgi:hypothetical protein